MRPSLIPFGVWLLCASAGLGCGGSAASALGTGGGPNSTGTTAGASGSSTTTAGVSGSSTTTAGAPSSCGVHDAFGSKLLVNNTTGPNSGVYDGPAIVERSTAQDLILYYAPTDPSVGATDTTASHCDISGPDSLPILPAGAKLWLSDQPALPWNYTSGVSAWGLTLRDHQGGKVLLGAARNLSDLAYAPITTGGTTPICTAATPDCPTSEHSELTYSAVEVEGDSPVMIGDSQTGTVELGGDEYSVRVTAQQVTGPSGFSCGADFHAQDFSGVSVDVQAEDVQSLIGGLEIGPPPACAQGDAPAPGLEIDLYGQANGTAYDGPAFYVHKDASFPGFDFSLPGLTAGDPALAIRPSETLFPEPSVGQEFWATIPGEYGIAALREAQRGALLLGTAIGSAPFDASTASQIEGALGVSATAVEACQYVAASQSSVPESLWDVVFGTTPPVRIKSGEQGTLLLGGKSYSVWVWGEGAWVSFQIW